MGKRVLKGRYYARRLRQGRVESGKWQGNMGDTRLMPAQNWQYVLPSCLAGNRRIPRPSSLVPREAYC